MFGSTLDIRHPGQTQSKQTLLTTPRIETSEREALRREEIELQEAELWDRWENAAHIDPLINDKDFPRAPNFYTFVFDERFLGAKLFPKQIEFCSKFFSDICWNTACTDYQYANCIPTDARISEIERKITFMEFGKCPKCGTTRDYWWKYGKQHGIKLGPYHEMIGLAGQRSGKSYGSGYMQDYQIHWILKTPNYNQRMSLGKNSVLESTITAQVLLQAKRTFDVAKDAILKSKWFSDYHTFLAELGKAHNFDYFTINEMSIIYRHRNLRFCPASPSRRALRGATGVCSTIDEIGWIGARDEKKAERGNPDEVYAAITNRLSNVVTGYRKAVERGDYDLPPPMSICISSPSQNGDKITRLYEEGKAAAGVLCYHYTTFEMNPEEKENTEWYRDRMRTLGRDAYYRDYHARPPMSAQAFIDDIVSLHVACRGPVNPVVIQPYKGSMHEISLPGQKAKNLKAADMHLTSRPNDLGVVRVMGLDAGESNNSFAACIAQLSPESGCFIIEALVEIIPEQDAPLSFPSIVDMVLDPLMSAFGVCYVTADRWNSTYVLQSLAERNGAAWGYNKLTYPHFVTMRESLSHGDLILPEIELPYKSKDGKGIIKAAADMNGPKYPLSFEHMPVAHLLGQFLTVEDLAGKDVIKGVNKTDDLFRAMVMAHMALTDAKIAPNLPFYMKQANKFRNPTSNRTNVAAALIQLTPGMMPSGGGAKAGQFAAVSHGRSGGPISNNYAGIGRRK